LPEGRQDAIFEQAIHRAMLLEAIERLHLLSR